MRGNTKPELVEFKAVEDARSTHVVFCLSCAERGSRRSGRKMWGSWRLGVSRRSLKHPRYPTRRPSGVQHTLKYVSQPKSIILRDDPSRISLLLPLSSQEPITLLYKFSPLCNRHEGSAQAIWRNHPILPK